MPTTSLLVLLIGLGYFAVAYRLFPILQSIHNRLKVIETFRTEFCEFRSEQRAQHPSDPNQLPDEFLFPSAFALPELAGQRQWASELFAAWLESTEGQEKDELQQEIKTARDYLGQMIRANQQVRGGLKLPEDARADVVGDRLGFVPFHSKQLSWRASSILSDHFDKLDPEKSGGQRRIAAAIAAFRRWGWTDIRPAASSS